MAKILIIEDEEQVRKYLRKTLELNGYEVIEAANGKIGISLCSETPVDLVITDIVMPYVSGTGLVTALKESNPRIPVIAITGYGEEPEAVATEKKADLVLSKPVKMAELKEHIARLLSSSKKEKK